MIDQPNDCLNDDEKSLIYFDEIQKQGIKDICKYFDRMHDKIFSFNNMLIAGYFVIIAMPQSTISSWWIILPIVNMIHLVYVDYKMMEKSRFEGSIMSKSLTDIHVHGKNINKITQRSLLTICLTLLVTIVFVIQFIIVI